MTGADESMSLLSLIIKGGYMMVPIFILSLATVYIFVERIRTIRRAAQTRQSFLDQVRKLVAGGDLQKLHRH
jgi:biopolymer transport protein ExbB